MAEPIASAVSATAQILSKSTGSNSAQLGLRRRTLVIERLDQDLEFRETDGPRNRTFKSFYGGAN
jgi:hypothetical protein